MKPTYAGPKSISVATHRATASYADQRREFLKFNNIVIHSRGPRGWMFSATKAVAEGISRLGFDVTADDGVYFAKRPMGYVIVNEAGAIVEPDGDSYRLAPSSVDAR